ncbi:hypothetical protein NDU88_004590 [Pleurodeles waltl]|uniref:Uncharacterized protein n=1 Tax=Pleurodeles waltl TaxID=8319 RepID=A0AAV7TSB8_PLEWA|nr:hypothetical protein NDU88_004590 [Pleurodeles waltl]
MSRAEDIIQPPPTQVNPHRPSSRVRPHTSPCDKSPALAPRINRASSKRRGVQPWGHSGGALSVNPPHPLHTRQQGPLACSTSLNGAAALAARALAAPLFLGAPISVLPRGPHHQGHNSSQGTNSVHRSGSPRHRAPNHLRPRPSAPAAAQSTAAGVFNAAHPLRSPSRHPASLQAPSTPRASRHPCSPERRRRAASISRHRPPRSATRSLLLHRAGPQSQGRRLWRTRGAQRRKMDTSPAPRAALNAG